MLLLLLLLLAVVPTWLAKRGRLLEMRRMWRVKKPWFCVEKDGYPAWG